MKMHAWYTLRTRQSGARASAQGAWLLFATMPIPRRPFFLPGASFRAYALSKGRKKDGRTDGQTGGHADGKGQVKT